MGFSTRKLREAQGCKLADATAYEWELMSMFLEVVESEQVDILDEGVIWHEVASVGNGVLNAIEADRIDKLDD